MEGVPRSTIISVVLVAALLLFCGTASATTDFIKTSCKATRYPALCVKSLSMYVSAIQQSPKQLARTALAVSLDRAWSASKYVSQLHKTNGLKPRERAAVKDCLNNVGDSVYELARSAQELSQAGRKGSAKFRWHMSNVQTWVSAAITDEYTCVDELAETAGNGELKAALRSRVVHVARLTSNALALVNLYVGAA